MSGGPVPTALDEALARLEALYSELEVELAVLQPRCELSGRCCNFLESGLTLFATDLELEWLRRKSPHRVDGDPRLCPHWQGGLCSARDGRPLGCRVYFCDATKKQALEELSERFHAGLKRIHDETGVDYSYGPFLERVRAAR